MTDWIPLCQVHNSMVGQFFRVNQKCSKELFIGEIGGLGPGGLDFWDPLMKGIVT